MTSYENHMCEIFVPLNKLSKDEMSTEIRKNLTIKHKVQ